MLCYYSPVIPLLGLIRTNINIVVMMVRTHVRERPSLCICVRRGGTLSDSAPFIDVSYPFIMSEGSSVSTQAAELTKRFSGGRAALFPATFLETSVITQEWAQQQQLVNKPSAHSCLQPPTHQCFQKSFRPVSMQSS